MQLEEIYDRYGDRLYHYLTLKLGSPSDAEDVLQEVFCRLLRYRIRFRFIREPAAFVFRVARNEAIRFIRRRARERKSPGSIEEIAGVIQNELTGPDPSLLNRMSGALAQIPEKQREVIILKFFEELTFKQISEVCGVSLNTTASRYRYGMQRLRFLMEEGDE
ncbi:MAG: RNA polymerase sigma factor [Candidatus Aminicenantaceae bacterium]